MEEIKAIKAKRISLPGIISTQQAIKLTELGILKSTYPIGWLLYWVDANGKKYDYKLDKDEKLYPIIYTSFALKWIRDNFNTHVFADATNDMEDCPDWNKPHSELGVKIVGYYFNVYPHQFTENGGYDVNPIFKTFEEAESAGLDFALDILLKQK